MRYDLYGSFKASAPWYSLDIDPDTQTATFDHGCRFPHEPPLEYQHEYQLAVITGCIDYLTKHWVTKPLDLKESATDGNPGFVDRFVERALQELTHKKVSIIPGNQTKTPVSSTYKATNKQTEDKMATYPTTQEILNKVNQTLNSLPHVMPVATYDAAKKTVVFSEGLDETYSDRFSTKAEKLAVEYWATVYRINAVSQLVCNAHMFGGTPEARMVLAKTNKVLCALSREQESYVEAAVMEAKKAQVLNVTKTETKPAKPAAAKLESKPAPQTTTQVVGETTYKVTTLPRVEPVVKKSTPVKEVTAKDIEAQVARETAYAPAPVKPAEPAAPKVNLPHEIWPKPEHETTFDCLRRCRQNLDVARRTLSDAEIAVYQAEFDTAKANHEQATRERNAKAIARATQEKVAKAKWEAAARILFPTRDIKFLSTQEKAKVTRSMKPKAPKAPKAVKPCETTRWQELADEKFGAGTELTKVQKAAVTRAYNKETGTKPAKTKTVYDVAWFTECRDMFGTLDPSSLTPAQKAAVTRSINKAAK